MATRHVCQELLMTYIPGWSCGLTLLLLILFPTQVIAQAEGRQFGLAAGIAVAGAPMYSALHGSMISVSAHRSALG